MTDEKRKTQPPLFLDMPFEEALGRFVQTDPKEVQENVRKAKKKRPPGEKASSDGQGEGSNVRRLRDKRERNHG